MYYFEPLTAFVDSVSEHYGIPACDMLVYKDGEEVYRHLAGFSDAEGGEYLYRETSKQGDKQTRRRLACTVEW